ncbi:cell wall-active antibiotics response protein LiaF [Bacillus infantis]|uniref:cell wall-active antibiotics response protein LiaF n=1 Tax=Bacillus infantis TaxID=324767 RepID=UPI001CD2F19B|nr:cell wall-active antibiotics response protein LiaF [Bacillus infantis]MCA1040656.1 cell wall-active antibiotics response protein LiaF [Bacillus infantis]
MLKKIKSEYISWILLLGALILFLEVSFFNHGLIFSLLVSIGMVYFGRKRLPHSSGKILFWAGLAFFVISVFNMMTFKFFLLAILIHFVIQYAQSKRDADRIRPVIKEADPFDSKPSEEIIKGRPLFENILFGRQKTPEHVYEWSDINIQAGIGDTIIDLSYTVLPKGETVIFIRNFIGNIHILVPYDLEVNVYHSVIAGSAGIFEKREPQMFNQTLQFKTPGYEEAEQKIKIFTSLLVGDIEVKRV